MGQDVTTLGVVYNDSSYDTALLWTSGTGRYQAIHEGALYHDDHMWAEADSFQVSVNAGAAALILFRGMGIAGGVRDELSFTGRFCQLTNAAPGTYFEAQLAPLGWSATAQSVMLVHTQRVTEVRRSFRDDFLDPWNTAIGQMLPDGAEQDGDPAFSWDAFPIWDTQGYLSPNKIYLTILQKLVIDVPSWPSDYEAKLKYWLRVFRASDGTLKGFVQRLWVWVESGAWTQQVLDQLAPNAQAAVPTINARLQQGLDAAGAVSGLYLLPGRQLTPATAGHHDSFLWNAVDDVTLVIEP